MNREDLQIISRHSNLSKEQLDTLLKDKVYSTKQNWHKFLKLFFLSLSVGFITAGIIFFFAYNWADLNKFTKIGLVEGLILVITAIVVFTKLNSTVKNILLTGTSVLVGVLFAVFGQIYQTGANAYDFFLGWTLFITIWVLVVNFAPLWLVYITLINTTFFLYAEQIANGWPEILVYTILFIINAMFVLCFLVVKHFSVSIKVADWLLHIVALAAICFCTIGVIEGIYSSNPSVFLTLGLLTAILYTGGFLYGIKNGKSFYIATISFSLIVIISAVLLKISDELGMLFFVCFFLIASVTLVIKLLMKLQKRWEN